MTARSPRALRVALLGAESTGKTALSQALASALAQRGLAARVVPEWLRTWCEDAGRTPRSHEQMDIACTHARQLDQAAEALHGPAVLIADTTPLMVAVYSDLLFGDASLYPVAHEHQRSYDTTLLMGLDLPWVADGLQRDGPHVRPCVDARVRAALDRFGLPYQVVYGHGEARLAHALRAVLGHPAMAPWTGRGAQADTARWHCECGSDAACEHRLFRRLQGLGPP